MSTLLGVLYAVIFGVAFWTSLTHESHGTRFCAFFVYILAALTSLTLFGLLRVEW